MNTRIFAITAAAFIASALTHSCINDEWAECPPPRIVVKLAAELEGTLPVPGYDIETVRVYVFDSDGRCADVWQGGRYTPGEEYTVPVNLQPGSYTLVAWTNLHEEVFGVSNPGAEPFGQHINTISLFRNMPPEARVTFDVPDLLHGDIETEVAYTLQPETIVIPISPVTYRVTWLVTGLPDNGDEYRFTVSDTEFSLGFNGAVTHTAAPAKFFYERTAGLVMTDAWEYRLTATITMVGLSEDDKRIPPAFALENITTGIQYYPSGKSTGNLIDMIIRTYQAQHNGTPPDFSRQFEFLVPLHFVPGKGLGVELDLRPWYYLESNEWII